MFTRPSVVRWTIMITSVLCQRSIDHPPQIQMYDDLILPWMYGWSSYCIRHRPRAFLSVTAAFRRLYQSVGVRRPSLVTTCVTDTPRYARRKKTHSSKPQNGRTHHSRVCNKFPQKTIILTLSGLGIILTIIPRLVPPQVHRIYVVSVFLLFWQSINP